MRTRVVSIAPAADGSWEVTTIGTAGPDGDELARGAKRVTARYAAVLVCTGEYSNPLVPDWPGRAAFGGTVMHSRYFTDASIARGKDVVVVGAGKSALDVAQSSALAEAASTTVVMRTPRWALPRKLLGLVPAPYIGSNRFGAALAPPAYMRPGGICAALREGRILTALFSIKEGLLYPIAALSFWLLGMLVMAQFGHYAYTPTNSALSDAGSAGAQILSPKIHALIRAKKVKVHQYSGVARLEPGMVVLQDGTSLPATLIIAATGFSKNYDVLSSVLPELGKEKDGIYLYKQMFAPSLRRLVFVGCELSSYNNCLSAFLQAQVAVAVLSGRVELPSASAMADEIEIAKAWKRRYVQFSHDRAARMQAMTVPYHDDLVTLLGYSKWRKSNPIAEIVMPYTAADYPDVLAVNLPKAGPAAATGLQMV
jgi:cation diffusion facilitator CzcD-associated flavoprotein CzcO